MSNGKIKNLLIFWKKMSLTKKIVSSGIAIILVCATTGTLVFNKSGKGMEISKNNIQQTEVTNKDISNTIVGTGTIENDSSDSITVPSGITINEVKVESGDTVAKGDTLATVDITSVLEAMENVQEQIEELDEQIEECKDNDETQTVSAKISGTIKKIYGKKGESVAECVAQNGAVMTISINGNSNQTIEITASGGTISKINVKKGDVVSVGDTLFTIKNDEESVEYKKYISQRKKLVATLKKLTEISETGTIVADIDGTVGDVNISDGNDSSTTTSNTNVSTSKTSSTSSSDITVNKTSATTNGTSVLVTNTSSNIKVMAKNMSTASTDEKQTEATFSSEKEISDLNKNSDKLTFKITNSGDITKNNLSIALPKTGQNPQNNVNATDGSYTGSIVWNITGETFEAQKTYYADVTLNAADGYMFETDSITQIQTGLISGISVSEDKKTISFKITFPETLDNEDTNQSKSKENTTPSDSEQNDNKEETTTEKETKVENKSVNISDNRQDNIETTDSNSADEEKADSNKSSENYISASDSSNVSETTQTTSEASDEYSDSVTAFTLASNDNMLISVSVDELDINSVEVSQEAQVTLDAIEDEIFTGTVQKVGNTASSSSGGVSKYTVKITIPKDTRMKEGMNASATIVIESRENVLTIPVNALQEKGNKTFVYTKKDEDGNLSGETEIQTGLSDGDNVEITEGLSQGDIVYYQKTGNTSKESNNEMPGEAPNGNMPQGGDSSKDFGGQGGNMPAKGPGQGGNQ